MKRALLVAVVLACGTGGVLDAGSDASDATVSDVATDAAVGDADASMGSDALDAQPDACWYDPMMKAWNCADACVWTGVMGTSQCPNDAAPYLWDCPPGPVVIRGDASGFDHCGNTVGPCYTCCDLGP